MNKNESDLLDHNGFFSRLDYSKLVKLLRESTNYQIVHFKNIISRLVYNFSNIKEFYEVDKEVIDKLIDELNIYFSEIEKTQIIRANNIKDLIRNLEDIKKRLIT